MKYKFEEKERKFRSCNLVLHGVAESRNQREEKTSDQEFAESLIQAVGSSALIKEVIRLGKRSEDRTRPMKVILNCEAARNEVLGNLTQLKNNDRYKGVSITEDYTLCERELIKDFIKQAKAQNDLLPHDSPIEFKVRGTPKNGLWLKEVKRKTPQHSKYFINR